MVDPCIATLLFGFQNPGADDFGRLAGDLLAKAEAEIDERRRQAHLMLLPSVVFYLLFAFGLGTALWTIGFELRPVALAAATSLAFVFMAGLGVHFKEEADWARVAEGAGMLHRRLLAQALAVKILTGAFFILPALVMRNLTALFPRRPQVDHEVLSLATNLAAALDEAVPVAGLETVLPRDQGRAVIDQAILLLIWAGAASVVRRAGHVILHPGPRRDALLAEIMRADPFVICLSALTCEPSSSRKPSA